MISKLDLAKLQIGISKCLYDEKFRYKRLVFAVDVLKHYADFHTICPETAISLSSSKQTTGLYFNDQKSLVMSFNDQHINSEIYAKMAQFCQQVMSKLTNLCGYIVCAKSSSCGLGNTKVYNSVTLADGLFTACLRRHYPWLPIEDNQRLADPNVQDHFVIRLFALQRLNQLKSDGLTRHGLLEFHSRYKLLLLAHSQPLYRQIGPFVAELNKWDNLDDFFDQYRDRLMMLLSFPATKENHTNVLMHVQGYFNRYLSREQKQALTDTILAYRKGKIPLSQPISCLKTYLAQYPKDYLSGQYYFMHYPQALPVVDHLTIDCTGE